MSIQAPSLRQAEEFVAELRTRGADLLHIHPQQPSPSGWRDWTVELTTSQGPLTVEVIRLWEDELLAVEQRRPGCHFLGWRTCQAPELLVGQNERLPDRCDAGTPQRGSQRELVIASLLRRPLAGRRGIVHGRGTPR